MNSHVDYEHYMLLENWSMKDASLILCGFNPDNYRDIRSLTNLSMKIPISN